MMRQIAGSFLLFSIMLMTAGSNPPARVGAATMDSHPPQERVSEDSYWELVQRSLAITKTLDGLQTQDITQPLASLADEWEALKEVQMVEGQIVAVNNSYLVESLRAGQPDLEKINGILNSLLAAHQEYPRNIFTSADLSPLHTILAQPEFTYAEQAPNPFADLYAKLMNRLIKWLESILGNTSFLRGSFWNVFSITAVVVLAFALFLALRIVLADFVKEEKIPTDENSPDELLTSETAFKKAQVLSQGGDFRTAVRYLYLSSLLTLDERGLLRYDRSKTNREYLRSVSDSPELVQPLREVIEVFDDVWYGHHILREDTFDHYSERVRELKEKKS